MTHGNSRMAIRIKTDNVVAIYNVRPLSITPVRSFQLTKRDDRTVYRVWESSSGTHCNCPSAIQSRNNSNESCKHVRVLRNYGMVE